MSSKGQPSLPTGADADSLLRRLAGPSSTKAGLAKDQTEINKVIAEVSKGSKFYENEKRKDKDLTERIARVLKARDEVVKGVDLKKVEECVDKLIAQLETQRDLSQFIVHIDMDAFYASVELLDKPELASKPFGVGGGVLCTASYEARKFGVRSGMAAFVAKKLCPDLIILPMHFDRYGEMSRQVMAVFRRYDPNMSVVGCDEGYLNITSHCEQHSISPEECVAEMRRIVHEETKLTASAGIAPNKMLAKICSDKNKPNGQFKLGFDPQSIKAFMHDLSIRKVPGVGRVNERLLDSIGIKTCGDIFTQRVVLSLMDKQFGLTFLLQTYLGIASNVVEPWQREERKSIGAERTFHTLSDPDKIYAKLNEVAVELSKDMTEDGWTGKTVTLKYKLDNFQVFTRAKSLTRWVSTRQEVLFAIGKELLKPELPVKLRLIGLRVTKLKDLKAEAESKARGIKRFFSSAQESQSPKKKVRRMSCENDDLESEVLQLSQDGFATSMPGYHEDADADEAAAEEAADAHGYETEYSPSGAKPISEERGDRGASPRPSISSSANQPKPLSSARLKPSSAARSRASSAAQSTDQSHEERPGPPMMECPICLKILETDNQGLNEHIDFCLSKQAIKEAQTASLKPSSSGNSSAERGRKPGHKPSSRRSKPSSASAGHGEGLLRYQKKA